MKQESSVACGCWLLILLFNLALGGWSVDVILGLFEKDIPWYGDLLIGLIVAELSVPVALVIVILQFFGAI